MELQAYLHASSPNTNSNAPGPRSKPLLGSVVFEVLSLALIPSSRSEGDCMILWSGCSPGSHTHSGVPHGSQKNPCDVCPAIATAATGLKVPTLESCEAENHSGNVSMPIAANKKALLTGISSVVGFAELQRQVSHSGFYQQFAKELARACHTAESLRDAADRLLTIADHAYFLRHTGFVEQVSEVLLNAPLPRAYKSASQYYRALVIKRLGKFDAASTLLERVAEDGPPRYRARAILSLGAVLFDTGKAQAAVPLYADAARAASAKNWCDPLTTVQSHWMIAAVKGIEGDHTGALNQLEALFPHARAIASTYPSIYYDYVNSLAVEFLASGRLTEADNASRFSLASPYAFAYPEWHETGRDIALKARRASRSVVAIGAPLTDSKEIEPSDPAPVEVLKTPALQAVPKPASVLPFPRRPPRPEIEEDRPSINAQELQRMPLSEKVALLMAHAEKAGASEELYDKLLHRPDWSSTESTPTRSTSKTQALWKR